MASGIIHYFTLDFNCGFARTAVRELTPRGRWRDESYISKRKSEFKQLFSDCEHYGLQETYFESKPNLSDFDRDCEKVLKLWSNRWNPSENRKVYEETFATTRWKDLPLEEKHTHTLTKCKGCYKKFGAIQHLFPQGPYYDYNPIVSGHRSITVFGEKASNT